MNNKTNFYLIGLLAVFQAIILIIMLPLSSPAGSFTPPARVESPAVLHNCSLVSDQELNNIRGRYDTYYFGLDIGINLTGKGVPVSVTPHTNLPAGTVIDPRGISFSDPNVTYKAGIGPQSIYQTVRVAGDNKVVTGVVNLDITVPKSLFTGGLQGIHIPKGTKIGLGF